MSAPRDLGSSSGPDTGHAAGPDAGGAAGAGTSSVAAPAATAARAAPERGRLITRRVLALCALSIPLALVVGFVARALTMLIGLITNLCFHARVSTEFSSPVGHDLGAWVVLVPIGGALIIGVMARYGSAAIRGHGIPEAMEQVLHNHSRIPPRVAWLKPVSAALSIGTGGPFGAEGPIIATGGALGSLLGQLLRITSDERKTLLAAGAAAGMSATFGSPVSAVLLAIELLLFEFRPRSIIPVALAAATANAVRIALYGDAPAFHVSDMAEPGGAALACYVLIGALVGLASVGVTRAVYGIEDLFAKLPLHWMWWPALGAIAVGVVGYFEPRTMGVGYDNIERITSGEIVGASVLVLCALKFVSWAIALGSGTSGGTLAPLFTIGGGIGSLLGGVLASAAPSLGVDVRVGALVGMASMFAGASRALLASVVFAFETTRQPLQLLPLLGACSAAFLVSCLCMRNSIMTEKIARRGTRVPVEYAADYLERILVGATCTRDVVTLEADSTLESVRRWIALGGEAMSHQGFPVRNRHGALVGVVTRRELLDPANPATALVRELVRRAPVCVSESDSLRDAADAMVREKIGRLAVVAPHAPRELVGILTRSDILAAHEDRLAAAGDAHTVISLPRLGPPPRT